MPFTELELQYLASQQLGRLATVQPDGTLQVSPVGFTVNTDLGTIDIGGFTMATSRKFLNVVDNGRVAFVVDDIRSTDPWRVRCVEIRGTAEGIFPASDAKSEAEGPLIRIRPRRIISFGIGPEDVEPHLMVANRRNVG
jgi:pyridoxamine 5'-phosphate oxidase family protein